PVRPRIIGELANTGGVWVAAWVEALPGELEGGAPITEEFRGFYSRNQSPIKVHGSIGAQRECDAEEVAWVSRDDQCSIVRSSKSRTEIDGDLDDQSA